MATISIKRRPKDGLQPNEVICETKLVSNAAVYMWGKIIPMYQLFINGREYSWPNDSSWLTKKDTINHIRHCIELDRAFYGGN